MNLSVGVQVFVSDDTPIGSHAMDTGMSQVEVITIGHAANIDGAVIYLHSREQAERLFDAVSEATMRWRERQPDQATVDAVISDPDHIWMGPHDDCDIDGPHQHPGEEAAS